MIRKPRKFVSKRILVIGMADSVHLARWLEQFSESEYTFEIVSSSPHRRVHPRIESLLDYDSTFHLGALTRYLSLPLWIADRFFSDFFRGLLIAFVASRFKPHLVHIFESQNGGYAFLRALQMSRVLSISQTILTPYGSDFYWFKGITKHRRKLERLLSVVRYISAECKRDETLAAELGFRGTFLPRIPASGGLTWPSAVADTNGRSYVTIKGYENKWGVASNALLALRPLIEELRGYEIVLFSCNRKILPAARRFKAESGLPVWTYTKGALTHDEVQRILGNSILLISLSRSDGLPASMVEAMVNGAVPIQSDSSCCNEWIEEGKGGFIVKFDDIAAVTQAVSKVLGDDKLRKAALETNRRLLLERLSPEKLRAAALLTYGSIL